MRTRPFAHTMPAVAVAGLMLITGCTSTSSNSTASHGAAAGIASRNDNGLSAASPNTSGAVHLTEYMNSDGTTGSVILSGAIGDYGKAQSVNPDGSVNTEHNSQLNLELSHGSFRLNITDLDERFVATLANLPVNTKTCSVTAAVSARVPVVPGSGTSMYKAVKGGFRLTVTLDEVYKPTACNETGAYLAQTIIIAGTGTVTSA